LKSDKFLLDTKNATNLNISVYRGSAATHFRCGGQCYISFCWKFNGLSSSERTL